jgi:hypothetical protein
MPDFKDVYQDIISDLYKQASDESADQHRPSNYLQSPDGTFLGKLTANGHDADGIFNRYGAYGSKYSPQSIFNRFGPYGSKYSATSPFNRFANEPPIIYLDHQPAGRLTENRFVAGARDPDTFLQEVRQSPRFRF